MEIERATTDRYDIRHNIMSAFTDIWNRLLAFYAGRHEPENMRPLAEWFWRTLLMLCAIAVVAILAHALWSFFGIMQKLSASQAVPASRQPELLSKAELQEFLASYAQRASEFEAAQTRRPTVVDPSR